MPFNSFFLIAVCTYIFVTCNFYVDANPQSASSGKLTVIQQKAQSENQFHAQAKTIARGTRASLQIITRRLELLENLGLWMMSTRGANATSTVVIQANAITGIGTIQAQCMDSVYYIQR